MNFGASSFQYDPFGRRVSKSLSGNSTSFLYDGVNSVQELLGSTPSANLLTDGVDEYFMRVDASGAANFLTDGLGSSMVLADANGNTLTQYAYEPFGTTGITGSSTNPYQYTGRENDVTGLYFYRSRYYSPTLQRFISEDPVGIYSGDVNFYAYVRNNPASYTDPSGLSPLAGRTCDPCSRLPNGRSLGVSNYYGAVGSVGGSVELVMNYDSGQVSVFATGGVQVGWNGGASASAFSGFIHGPLGASNGGYSAGFSGAGASYPLPIEPQVSGGGYLQRSSNGIKEYGLNVSAALLGRFGFGYNWTQTSQPLSLGRYWLYSPLDWAIWAARRALCP